MKVRELIEKLGLLDPEAIVAIQEDPSGGSYDNGFKIGLDIVDIDIEKWGYFRICETNKKTRYIDLYKDELAAREAAHNTNENTRTYKAKEPRIFVALIPGHENDY